jgi:hypothetical protein
MSGEIQKWQGGLPDRLETRIQKWREKQTLEIATQHRREPVVQQSHAIIQGVTKGQPGEVVWLPRKCAHHGKPWVAAYIRDVNGQFVFMETIRMTESLWRQNSGNTVGQVVDIRDRSREECPWCGATYRHWGTPVSCTCGAKVCYGRTTGDDYFRCYCGKEGKLKPGGPPEVGFAPTLRRGDQEAD